MSIDTLVLVQSIVRHGERTPDLLSLYPTDPHKSEKYFPYGYGMLTNEGKQTMYITGKAFRNRYDKLIGDLYFPEQLETWSSVYERCRNSAALLLAGLFPPKGPQKWDDELNWLPIPINYASNIENDLFAAVLLSKTFMDAYSKEFETSYGKSLLKKYRELIAYIEKHTEWKIYNTRKLLLLQDIFTTQEALGMELPEWSKLIYPDQLMEAAHDEYAMQVHTKELKRITSGLLLKKILNETLDRISGKSNRKMILYVGHDLNIISILTIMGIMYKHSPQVGAALNWELHNINGKYGFKMFYKKDKNLDFEPLTLRNGELVWWIDNFEEFVKELWTDDDSV